MATDLSALGIKITPEGIVKATQELTAFAKAADMAGKAGSKGFSTAGIDRAANAVSAKSKRVSVATETEAQQHTRLAAVVERSAQRQVEAARRVAAAQGGGSIGSKSLASSQSLIMSRGVSGISSKPIEDFQKKASQAFKFTAHEGLNFSRQMADVGVTAAMGMNPLMIALQQGPQLFDIMQQAAVRTGATISSVFRATAKAALAALAPLLPAILAITAVIASIGLVMRSLVKSANEDSGLKKYTKEMGYTKAEVKELNDMTVGYGHVAKAAFQLAGEAIWQYIGPAITSTWNTMKEWAAWIGSGLKFAINFMVGGFVGAFNAVKKTWAMLPAALGDSVISAVNIVIQKVDELVNKSINSINGLIGKLPFGLGERMTIEWRANSGRLENAFQGTMAKVGQIAQDELKKAQGVDYLGNMADAVIDRARQLAQDEQAARAAELIDPKKGGAGKKDRSAERLADILARAEADVRAEEMRAKAIGMTAHAAAELEQKERILEDLQRAKITMTPKLAAEVDRLAKAYADAAIKADSLAAVQKVLDGALEQKKALEDETKLIGLYGDELIRARNELQLLAAARASLPLGVALTGPQEQAVKDAAGGVSDVEIGNKQKQFLADMTKAADDAAFADKRLRDEIGLTEKQLAVYRYQTDLLNDARQRGIKMTPEVIAAINQTGQAMGEAAHKTQEISDRARAAQEGLTNMFMSIFDGSKNAKQAVGELIKELALLEARKAISGLISKGISFIGGLLGAPTLNALGGTYSGPGIGAYSSSVVDKPTLFPFAKGVGLMGEEGAEAIMPLKRGPDGSLGVQASNDNGGRNLHVSVSVDDGGNLRAMVRDEAGAVVAESAPQIVGQSVAATKKNFNKSRAGWR